MPGKEIQPVSDKQPDVAAQPDDSLMSHLAQDAWAIGSGIGRGLKKGVDEAVDHPGQTALRLGFMAGAGLLLGAAQARAGLLRLGVEALAVSSALSAYRNFSDAFSPMSGAGANLLDRQQRLNKTGERVGEFLFDATLMTAAGMAGAKVGQKYLGLTEPMSLYRPESQYVSSYDRLVLEKMNQYRGY